MIRCCDLSCLNEYLQSAEMVYPFFSRQAESKRGAEKSGKVFSVIASIPPRQREGSNAIAFIDI
jgi:hypothetical protein